LGKSGGGEPSKWYMVQEELGIEVVGLLGFSLAARKGRSRHYKVVVSVREHERTGNGRQDRMVSKSNSSLRQVTY